MDLQLWWREAHLVLVNCRPVIMMIRCCVVVSNLDRSLSLFPFLSPSSNEIYSSRRHLSLPILRTKACPGDLNPCTPPLPNPWPSVTSLCHSRCLLTINNSSVSTTVSKQPYPGRLLGVYLNPLRNSFKISLDCELTSVFPYPTFKLLLCGRALRFRR